MSRIERTKPIVNPADLIMSDEMAQASIQKVLTQRPILEELEDEGGGSKVDYVAVIKRYKDKVTNRGTAIRAKCVECSGGALSEVRDCPITACALYPYRMGTDPGNKKTRDRLAKEGEEE